MFLSLNHQKIPKMLPNIHLVYTTFTHGSYITYMLVFTIASLSYACDMCCWHYNIY